jgi:hypothetical protein
MDRVKKLLLLLALLESPVSSKCSIEVLLVTALPSRWRGSAKYSLLMDSAARFDHMLWVYHETLPGAAETAWSCRREFYLPVLYPWLLQLGTEPGIFGRVQANAGAADAAALASSSKDRVSMAGYPLHAPALTARATLIFRKVLAVRHGVLTAIAEGSTRVVVWADADVELKKQGRL